MAPTDTSRLFISPRMPPMFSLVILSIFLMPEIDLTHGILVEQLRIASAELDKASLTADDQKLVAATHSLQLRLGDKEGAEKTILILIHKTDDEGARAAELVAQSLPVAVPPDKFLASIQFFDELVRKHRLEARRFRDKLRVSLIWQSSHAKRFDVATAILNSMDLPPQMIDGTFLVHAEHPTVMGAEFLLTNLIRNKQTNQAIDLVF